MSEITESQDELRKIIEEIKSETFYTYSFIREETQPTYLKYRIAVKRGMQYYDVVSALPLTENDFSLDSGIGIENVEPATDEYINKVARYLVIDRDSEIYKRMMSSKLDQENRYRKQSVENRRVLLNYVKRIEY